MKRKVEDLAPQGQKRQRVAGETTRAAAGEEVDENEDSEPQSQQDQGHSKLKEEHFKLPQPTREIKSDSILDSKMNIQDTHDIDDNGDGGGGKNGMCRDHNAVTTCASKQMPHAGAHTDDSKAELDQGAVDKMISLIQSLARQPTLLVSENPELRELRRTVLMLSSALYQGPKLGVKAKKKAKTALCSPVLFLGGAVNKSIGSRARVGGPSQKHTFGCLESYLDIVAKCYYTSSTEPTDSHEGRADLFLQRKPILGKLSSMWRQGSPIDTWAPLEIALFESAICIHGKGNTRVLFASVRLAIYLTFKYPRVTFTDRYYNHNAADFATISRIIKTKSTKDVIEFYYFWKHSSHYATWKRHFE